MANAKSALVESAKPKTFDVVNENAKAGDVIPLDQVKIPKHLEGRVLRARRSRTGGVILTVGTPAEESKK